MPSAIGAILILAGSVLISAGIVTTTGYAETGFGLGGVVFVIGVLTLIAAPLKYMWNAIPVDGSDGRGQSDDQ